MTVIFWEVNSLRELAQTSNGNSWGVGVWEWRRGPEGWHLNLWFLSTSSGFAVTEEFSFPDHRSCHPENGLWHASQTWRMWIFLGSLMPGKYWAGKEQSEVLLCRPNWKTQESNRKACESPRINIGNNYFSNSAFSEFLSCIVCTAWDTLPQPHNLIKVINKIV